MQDSFALARTRPSARDDRASCIQLIVAQFWIGLKGQINDCVCMHDTFARVRTRTKGKAADRPSARDVRVSCIQHIVARAWPIARAEQRYLA